MRYVCSAIAAIFMSMAIASSGFAADAKPHRVAIHVDQNDPAVMNLALNNATNIMEDYKARGETVEIQLVTYGLGLHMLRDDTSPVKDRLKQIKDASFPSKITYAACGNTKAGMEKREGKAITIVSEAEIVPSGAVTLIELQEKGWTYLKP